MNTIKKLLIGLIGILLVVSGYNTPVYASELSGQENIGVSSEAAGIIYEDSVIDSEAAGMNSEDKVLNLEAFGTGTEGTVANPENIDANIENTESNSGESGKINLSGTEEASDESYPMDIEDFSDTDNYEIYVDEQGQICYIEKEPAEPVIEDDSDIPDDEQEDTGKSGNNYSESDLRLLACLVYAEAGNQSYKGMLAVANVVLNRVKSPVFAHANTIEEVIYDNKWTVQFTVTIKNKKTGKSILDKALECYDTGVFTGKNAEASKKAMNKAIKAAKAALNGENNIGNYLCFRLNNSKASSIKKKYEYKIIGDHIFYRTK